MISGACSVRLAQGTCLGDDILLAGAAVRLAKQLGGIQVACANYAYRSVCGMFEHYPEVEVYCQASPPVTDYRKLIDVNDPDAVIRELKQDGRGPIGWYDQLLPMPFLRPAYAIALGDSILMSGAVIASGAKVVPVKSDYLKSVSDLYANNPDIQVFMDCDPVEFDPRWDQFGWKTKDPAPIHWYSRFNVPFNERWDSCPIPALVEKVKPAKVSTVFVHDDQARGFRIPVAGYRPEMTP